MRRTGHIPDHAAVVARRAGLHLHPAYGEIRARAAALPLATTNRAMLSAAKGGPGILDQHDTGSCEGHAHASGVTLYFALIGQPLAELVSPVGLYYGALLFDRQPNLDGTLPDITDAGTMPSSILSGMSRWGGCGASVWGQYPASSQTLYVNPGDPNSPLIAPTPERLAAERAFRLSGAYFVKSSGRQKVIDIMSALASGRPVTIAIPASGPEFQGYSGGVLGALSGPIDHANLLVDYTWSGTQAELDAWLAGGPGDEHLVVYDVNSWSEGWGEGDSVAAVSGGLARANVAFVNQLEDPCVLDVVRVS